MSEPLPCPFCSSSLPVQARRYEIAKAVAAAIISKEGLVETSVIDPSLQGRDIALWAVCFADLLIERLAAEPEGATE